MRDCSLKEISATALATLVAVAFILAFKGTWARLDVGGDALVKAKELLQILGTFFGVVLGYYFGRIPAERSADLAQKRADTAVESQNQLRRTTTEKVQSALDLLRQTTGAPTGGSASPSVTPTGILEDLLLQLQRQR